MAGGEEVVPDGNSARRGGEVPSQERYVMIRDILKVCDESGRTVGFVVSVPELERLQRIEAEHRRLLYESAQALFSEEELDRAEQETEEFTTAEMLRHLEQL
jgi:hypothetical protein